MPRAIPATVVARGRTRGISVIFNEIDDLGRTAASRGIRDRNAA